MAGTDNSLGSVMRLGIYGGTFDPVHWGHLLLAECCREQCRLDEVWFVPAATPPHKNHHGLTPVEHRVAMLRLALAECRDFRVSLCEVERGGVSYTRDTLAEIHARHPDAELFFLLGADALRDLPSWREPAEIARLATLVVVHRADSPFPDWQALGDLLGETAVAAARRHCVEMPRIDLSSRDLRRRLARGQSIRFRLPAAVLDHIQQHQLYHKAEMARGERGEG